jgi:hypothetical protein
VEAAVRTWIGLANAVRAVRRRLDDEVGEGVISTAIAVLIMALIGLAMWQLFDRVFTDAGSRVESNVNQIG